MIKFYVLLTMPRKCINDPNSFCYICGEVVFAVQRRNITPVIKTAYNLYFGEFCKLGDQNKSWAPHICCKTCYTNLLDWLNHRRPSMPFAIPVIWLEPRNHTDNCLFCMVPPLRGMTNYKKKTIVYPNIHSATRPVPHSDELPVPTPPESYSIDSEEEPCDPEPSTSTDPDFAPDVKSEHHKISQNELNDLVRDLELSKAKAELLASRFQQWNYLAENVKVTFFRDRQKHLEKYFSVEGDLVFCSDVSGLLSALNINHISDQWRLFIDASKLSLKAVLLHNGNQLPSIPIGYSVHMKESYDSLKLLLESIHYNTYQWKICADFKVIAILTGLQLGYTKHCCFICEWNSRDRASHFIKKEWPLRQAMETGKMNIKHEPLVESENILIPPLHIKLGLIKNFAKKLDRNGPAFKYLVSKFPKMSEAKLKEGVFVGPQIRQLHQDEIFEYLLNDVEKEAWISFREVVNYFFGNKRAENYEDLVTNLLSSYHKMGCNMSLKLHFLHSHLNCFPESCGEVSDEHGERFHQQISLMEKRYQGKWSARMLADYCWTVIRDAPQLDYKREAKRKHI